MDFFKWYKNIVESSQEEPPSDVWEEIQDELDVDIVWHNLGNNLSKSKRRIMFYKMAAAASVLLVIGLGILLFHNRIHETEPKTYVINAYKISESDTLLPITKKETDKIQITSFEHELESLAKKESPEYDKDEQPDTQIIKEHKEILEPLPHLAYQPYQLAPDIKAIKTLFEITPFPDQIEEQIKPKGSYYAGLSVHAANTWLLNNKTIQGLKSGELTATIPSFGYNISIVAGRDFNKKFGIQAEIYFISQSRQNYNEYVHGKYVSNNMQFNYTNLSLSGRWMFFNPKENHGSHFLILGAYTGVLKNAVQHLNGTSTSLDNDYSSVDYGVAGGYEHIYPLGKNFTIGTGFQVKYGLKNIFSGNEYIPDYLNNTRNMSINLMLSVKYDLN